MVNGEQGSRETHLMDGKTYGNRAEGNLGHERLGNVTARAKVLTPSRQARPSTRYLPRSPDIINHDFPTWLQEGASDPKATKNYQQHPPGPHLPRVLHWHPKNACKITGSDVCFAVARV